MTDKNQGLYPTDVIANLLNISERRVEQLVKKKIIPKAGRGVFDLGSTVQSYIRYLQGICSGAIKSAEPSELDKRLLEAKVLERESKARQAKYRADAMEQELANKKLSQGISKIPDELLSLLSKLSDNHKLSDVHMKLIDALIRKIVKDILNGCESP